MMPGTCPREKEVKQLLERGQWPQACAPELRGHVGGCRSCGDLVLVTTAFRRARAEASAGVNLPPPGVLWWRAQLRRRNAAVERIGRPILGAQIFALCVMLLVAAGFVGLELRNGIGLLDRLGALPQTAARTLFDHWHSALLDTTWSPMVLIPAAATVALLGGVVVYLAVEKQ